MIGARYYVEQSGGMFRSARAPLAHNRPRINQGKWRRLSDHDGIYDAVSAAKLARDRGGLYKWRVRFRGKTVWAS